MQIESSHTADQKQHHRKKNYAPEISPKQASYTEDQSLHATDFLAPCLFLTVNPYRKSNCLKSHLEDVHNHNSERLFRGFVMMFGLASGCRSRLTETWVILLVIIVVRVGYYRVRGFLCVDPP